MIDLNHWSAAGLPVFYLACLFAAVAYLARPITSHVLPIRDGMSELRAPGSVVHNALVAIFSLMWSASLLMLETRAISEIAPHSIKRLSCQPRWLPPLECNLTLDPLAGRLIGLAILLACIAVALLVWRTARRTSPLLFALSALGLLASSAFADLIADATAPARSEILFGGLAAIQLTSAAGLAFALIIVPSLRPTVLLRVHVAYLAVFALRILALLSLMLFWPRVPSATAVSMLIMFMLIPGVAAGAAIIASAPNRSV